MDVGSLNKKKQAFFNSLTLKGTKCFAPLGECTETVIDSHSIQDSRILETLARDNHVVQITFDKACVSKATIDNIIEPRCKFELISIHKASVFNGLCNKHDTELFRPIDVEDLDLNNQQHVFLLTYRSVLKELETSINAAVMNQSMFLKKVELGEVSSDAFSVDGAIPVLFFEKAYMFNRYKELFDNDYISQSYDNIYGRHIILEGLPTFATSAVFTPVELSCSDEEPERLCINVFPYKGKTYVLFSCRIEDKPFLEAYINDIFLAEEYYQKYLISKLVLRNCENTVFSPEHYDKWSEEKKKAILTYYERTLNSDLIGYEDKELYLF